MAYQSSHVCAPAHIYIPGGLKHGTHIIVRGRTSYGSTGFAINLKCGFEEDCNIAFHFNPRPQEGVVVRNTFSGGWEGEERDSPYFPFSEGCKFQIRIYVSSEDYRVTVNGHDFITYGHRMDLGEVRVLNLTEGAEYYDVSIQNNMAVPYFGEFNHGMTVGKAVRVRGAVKYDAQSFAINFNCDCDGDTVGFHFNPRQSEGEVVRNAHFGGWGDEERSQPEFPFAPGDFFDALFVATEERFNVYVNQKFFTTFDYRCPVEDIKHLQVNGDVTLCDVEFLDPLPGDFMKEIPSGLEKSDMIVIKGFFFAEGNKFAINLINGNSLDDDIALHFNPRRDEREVVMNNCIGGNWQEEERESLPYAFDQMLPFEVKIVTKKNKFKIYVNGKKLCSFMSRTSVEDIKCVNVNGEAYIYHVKLLRRLDKPFIERIPGGIQENGWVIVSGTAKKNPDSFAINLQCGDSEDYNCDVAFHFNPRFSGEDSVRNTLCNGSWQEEEHDQLYFPFESKDAFEIAINTQPEMYRVYVNGQHYIDYRHRIDFRQVCHIMLTGDANFFAPEFY